MIVHNLYEGDYNNHSGNQLNADEVCRASEESRKRTGSCLDSDDVEKQALQVPNVNQAHKRREEDRVVKNSKHGRSLRSKERL